MEFITLGEVEYAVWHVGPEYATLDTITFLTPTDPAYERQFVYFFEAAPWNAGLLDKRPEFKNLIMVFHVDDTAGYGYTFLRHKDRGEEVREYEEAFIIRQDGKRVCSSEGATSYSTTMNQTTGMTIHTTESFIVTEAYYTLRKLNLLME